LWVLNGVIFKAIRNASPVKMDENSVQTAAQMYLYECFWTKSHLRKKVIEKVGAESSRSTSSLYKKKSKKEKALKILKWISDSEERAAPAGDDSAATRRAACGKSEECSSVFRALALELSLCLSSSMSLCPSL
jgi:hypothetical protein